MKCVLVGDIHIDNVKQSISNSDIFNEVLSLFGLIKETAFKSQADYIIFLGDIFNAPTTISSVVISAISEIIYDLSMEFSLIFIEGNHDIVDDKHFSIKNENSRVNVKTSLLTPFKYFKNVKVFTYPEVVNIDKNIEIAFMPFSNSIITDLNNVSRKFSIGSKKILMSHFDLRNSAYLEQGEKIAFNPEMPSASELIKNYGYDIVLLGHIHEPEEFFINGKLVKYVGSSRNINFSNVGETKGIYIFDFDTFNIEFVKNDNTNIFKTFRNLDDISLYCADKTEEELSKTKVKFVYSDSKDMQKINKLKEFFKSIIYEKSILSDKDGQSNTISVESLQEFEDMIKNNLITKDKVVEYAMQFKEPENKEIAMKIFNMVVKS